MNQSNSIKYSPISDTVRAELRSALEEYVHAPRGTATARRLSIAMSAVGREALDLGMQPETMILAVKAIHRTVTPTNAAMRARARELYGRLSLRHVAAFFDLR